MHRGKGILALLVVVGLVGVMGLRAQQEHPQEHPKKAPPKQEHPAAKPASTADLEKAIREHVEETAKKNDGKFPVKDDVLKKTWQLTLVRVHTDKLTQLSDTTYFACVDFKADDETVVDVDFYLEQKNDKLEVTDTSVHKVNGVARYLYEKKGDFWVRVTGQEQPKPQEHPKKEHPK